MANNVHTRNLLKTAYPSTRTHPLDQNTATMTVQRIEPLLLTQQGLVLDPPEYAPAPSFNFPNPSGISDHAPTGGSSLH